jgi:hypothetical protein
MDIVDERRGNSGIDQCIQVSRQRVRLRQRIGQRTGHPTQILRSIKMNVTVYSFDRRQHDYCFLLLWENNNRRQGFVAPANSTCSIKISPCRFFG